MPIILVTAKADPDDIVAGLDAGGDEYITKPVDHAALVARVRSILRIKALHDTVQEQAAQLEEWNRTLEQRVAAQLAEIERLGSLKRFLAPQVAELILSAGGERLLESHRREITVVFCDMRGFTAFAETSEPEEVMGVLRQYHEALGELIFRTRGRSSISRAMVWSCCSTILCPARTRPRARCAWRSRCARASPSSATAGAGRATTLASESASRRATPRSAGSVSRAASTTPRSARSRTWPRDCATRPSDGEILISQRALAAVEDSDSRPSRPANWR